MKARQGRRNEIDSTIGSGMPVMVDIDLIGVAMKSCPTRYIQADRKRALKCDALLKDLPRAKKRYNDRLDLLGQSGMG